VKTALKIVGFCSLVVFCFGFGFAWPDIRHLDPLNTGALTRLFSSQPTRSPEQLFRDSYNKILADYERPIVAGDLKYQGMEGLMDAVGDPHTMFLPPVDAKEFSAQTKARLDGGIGAKLQPDPLGAKTGRVFETGPAYAAGMRDNDVITAVDGKSVAGMRLDDVVAKIKGNPDTTVQLLVLRNGKTTTYSIRRQVIIIPTVDSMYFAKSGIGYLSVSSFSEPTAEQFDTELAKLERNSLKGLVIIFAGIPAASWNPLARCFHDSSMIRSS